MEEVLALIEKKKQEFAQVPFFDFLRDKSIDSTYRLSFTPSFAPFVMGFAELNKYVWREEPTNDPIQAIINQYTYEDENHWMWFVEDLQTQGFDVSLYFSDSLRFIWSDETQVSRQTIHELYRYTYRAIPIYKLAVIEAIEAIADVFISTTTQVTQELKAITNREYLFFGNHHVASESEHSMHSSEIVELIADIKLTEETLNVLYELVETVFDLFEKLVNELLVYTKKHGTEKLFYQERELPIAR